MNDRLIFLPFLAQMLLTMYVYFSLGRAKSKATTAGLVNQARRGLHDDAWPDNVLQISNNIRNQFELPVLFYSLIAMIWMLGAASMFAQIVAWLFVASRVVHTYVHTGSNYVPLRRGVFTFGFLTIAVLWAIAVVAVFTTHLLGPS